MISRGSTGGMKLPLTSSNASVYAGHTFFDLLDVAQHFAARPVFIVLFDRRDNPPMRVDGGLPAPVGLQRILTAST